MDHKKENESIQTPVTNSTALLDRQIKKNDFYLLISIISLIFLLLFYFFVQESFNYFYYTIIQTTLFISLLLATIPRLQTIEKVLNSRKNIESVIAYRRGGYVVLLIVAALILLLTTSFIISLLIIIFFLIFVSNELKIVLIEGKLRMLFLNSPMVLFSILVILIAISLGFNMISEFFPILIEISLTFIFTVFFVESLSRMEVPKENLHDETKIIKEKVREIFEKKTCEIHPSQIPSMTCLGCNRMICELCSTNYRNFCIHCHKQKIEARLLLFTFLTYLSATLLVIFLFSFIWGMYAPLPLILRFIEWLGLRYGRFTILFYYAVANLILLIAIGGGGIFASRQLKVRINQLESRINQAIE